MIHCLTCLCCYTIFSKHFFKYQFRKSIIPFQEIDFQLPKFIFQFRELIPPFQEIDFHLSELFFQLRKSITPFWEIDFQHEILIFFTETMVWFRHVFWAKHFQSSFINYCIFSFNYTLS